MKIIVYRALTAALLVLFCLAVVPLVRAQSTAAAAHAAPAPPRPSNKWRVVFDERARSDGTLSFVVWPASGNSQRVDVPIKDGTSENQIARAVRDALGASLGKGWHVETDDGEDVLVKARRGTPDFGLELVGNTVEDVDVKLRRE